MITHNEITALLWLLVAAGSGTTGLLIGRSRPWRKLLYDQYDRAYKAGADAGYAGGYDDGRYDERQLLAENVSEAGQGVAYPVRGAYPAPETGEQPPPASLVQPVRPAGPSPAAGRTTIERYTMEIEGLGSFGPATNRTIYPELAALAAESEPEPVPVLDPHWYARQMHELADWHVAAQADAAYFEQWLPGYLDWYRRSLESAWSAAGKMLETI